jgi:hypothetical protein
MKVTLCGWGFRPQGFHWGRSGRDHLLELVPDPLLEIAFTRRKRRSRVLQLVVAYPLLVRTVA